MTGVDDNSKKGVKACGSIDHTSSYHLHPSNYPRQLYVNDVLTEHFTFCDRDSHKRVGCFKLVGYPEWWPGKKRKKTKPRAAHIANLAGKGEENGEWIIDLGCTKHVTYQAEWLENKRKTSFESPVVIPNGQAIPIDGYGDHTLPGGVKINHVLHVPNFKYNLLSVNRLCKDLQCAVTFFPDFCVMQGLHTRNLIGAGKCQGGLYRMERVEEGRRAMMSYK